MSMVAREWRCAGVRERARRVMVEWVAQERSLRRNVVCGAGAIPSEGGVPARAGGAHRAQPLRRTISRQRREVRAEGRRRALDLV